MMAKMSTRQKSSLATITHGGRLPFSSFLMRHLFRKSLRFAVSSLHSFWRVVRPASGAPAVRRAILDIYSIVSIAEGARKTASRQRSMTPSCFRSASSVGAYLGLTPRCAPLGTMIAIVSCRRRERGWNGDDVDRRLP